MHPPKHFYVDLQDVETGVIHKHVYVSKHFNSWKSIDTTETLRLTRWQWKLTNGQEQFSFDSGQIRASLEGILKTSE